MTSRPCPSLAPCAPPSMPLRAAKGGGQRPALTAAVRGALKNAAGTEKRPRPNKETARTKAENCHLCIRSKMSPMYRLDSEG